MKHLLVRLGIVGVVVFVAAMVLPGVEVSNFWWAIGVGVIIALLNSTIGFMLRLLTLPINVLTFGLMSFVVTVLMVLLADNLLHGFEVQGFLYAALFALVVGVFAGILGEGDIL